jgi:hypothetical protein
MRIYNIYLDRIEIAFDDCTQGTLEYKLVALSQDLFSFYLTLPLGKGTTYRCMSYIIEDLVNVLDFSKHVDETHVVGILRNSLSFLRRFKFPEFQINIINHV